jgi:hypothetical protein
MNLILAVMWLLAALVLYLWPWLFPGASEPTIFDSGIPLSWLAMVMALYSLTRWWATRALLRQRQALREEERRRLRERPRARWQREPDPTFDFSEGPPPRKPPPADAG